jgi:iron complex outermembrane receptor protein
MTSLISLLHSTPDLCGVARSADGRIADFHRKGVVDLYTLVTTDPDFLSGGQLADRVIGRGAALLAVKGGVSEVYADTLSEHALEVLEKAGVKYTYGKLVPQITNWTGDGMCLVEALTLKVSDPDVALPLIHDFLQERGIIG